MKGDDVDYHDDLDGFSDFHINIIQAKNVIFNGMTTA